MDSDRQIAGGWIRSANAVPFLTMLSAHINYSFDEWDSEAVVAGLADTDADDPPGWWSYPRVGDVITIHGHNGATKLVWDDGGESSQEAEYRLNMTYVENGGKGPWCIHDDCRHWFEPQCDDNCKSVA